MTTPVELANAIESDVDALESADAKPMRAVRRRYSAKLEEASAETIHDIARHLMRAPQLRWLAFELIRYHPAALDAIGSDELEEFAKDLQGWGEIDAFAGFIAGQAWLKGHVPDEFFEAWTGSDNRWLRRAALVSTVVLNSPSHGGRGDVRRTLHLCRLLAADRDDMVIKALSWALRKLVAHDRESVELFLAEHENLLAARVKREVRNKLETGLKNPRRNSTAGDSCSAER